MHDFFAMLSEFLNCSRLLLLSWGGKGFGKAKKDAVPLRNVLNEARPMWLGLRGPFQTEGGALGLSDISFSA